jgi:hypothetical protein
MRLFRTDRRGNPIPSWLQRKRPNTRRHPHLPQLFYLAQNRNWNGVILRARSHPHEISVQEDISGDTALHICCRLDPPQDVVSALREQAASIPNADGAIPLHIAATHRCSSETIKVLLKRTTSTQDGQYGECSPTCVLTRMGRAPIHYACFSFRGLSLQAFQLLLEATLQTGHVISTSGDDLTEDDDDDEYSDQFDNDESSPTATLNVVTLRDSTGQTPLGLLFRRYRERVRIVIQSMDERLHPLAAALRVQADLGELWEKARWIVTRLAQEQKPLFSICSDIESPGEHAIAVEAAKWACERFSPLKQDEQRRTFRIVHASVSLTGYGCPPEMIRLALSIHPHQAKEMDEDGSLPIHNCAMAPSFVFNDSARSNSDDDSFISEFSVTPQTATTHQSTSTPHAFDKVFKILLQHYPASARVPHGVTGKLPLTLALDNRSWDDGVQTLLDAYPSALESKKMTSDAIYPWMLARIGNRPSTRKSRNAVFELLKAKPDLVKTS